MPEYLRRGRHFVKHVKTQCKNYRWGVYDVEDCCSGVEHLAKEGLVDPNKACIDGGSAGGYTTLACLTFKDTFKAGV